MQWKRIALGVMVILCMFTVYQAGAQDITAGQDRNGGGRGQGHGMNTTAILDRLETQGYDVSAIRAAIDGGNRDLAHNLLDQFRKEHPDAIPAPGERPAGRDPMDGDHLAALLERLSEMGYDVSEIQSALDNESLDTAMKLLRKFMEEHRNERGVPDRIPPGDGDEAGPLTQLLEHLEAQGYDVTAIRTAVESGDRNAVRTLLEQLRTVHPDALPEMAGPPGGRGAMAGDHLTGLLERLSEDGYDVSAIQAALESGDADTARSLLHRFMEEYRDELPKPVRPTETTA